MMRLTLALLLLIVSSPWLAVEAAQPTQQPQAPPGFQLTAAQQAYLDQVLTAWEESSDRVQTFSCPFVLYTYDAFSPAATIASKVETGAISYQKPDKGSFKIEAVYPWQAEPVAPGYKGPPKGQHKLDPDAIGAHWVCDGQSVYEYQTKQKLLVERPIPPHLQGKSIVDGPLPFLFGAEAEKLKRRFFMIAYQGKDKSGQPDPNVIQISAVPKTLQDAADYQMVEIQLDRATLLPKSMNVVHPSSTPGSVSRSAYIFYDDKVQVNATLDQMKWSRLFATPRTPMGWKKVVDAPQAAAAQQPQTR